MMSLAAGTRLGPYEILEPIGAGGMGEVYRAHDSRLGRDVAIKTCSAHFSERFEREARSIAALNHPHICALYDVGPDYLVMELVEGPTLATLMERGRIPMEEALGIARQIAEALEAAHEKSIVHRDLKPANVKLTGDGKVKVLDFGLAKAMDPDSSAADPTISPTLTLSATRAGVILGTAAYMSPEQARGTAVDKRADIWAFGVVLFEMLTGARVFSGETVSDTLAAVLRADLDWAAVPADTPLPIRKLLRRCLERDRKKRLRDAGDALIEIDEALAGSPPDAMLQAAPARQGATRRQMLLWALGSLALAASVGLWVWGRAPRSIERPVMRWSALLPYAVPSSGRPGITMSPDGSQFAYVGISSGSPQLFVRRLDQLEAKPVATISTIFAAGHFFSPDGQWIAYVSAGKLRKTPAAGGAPITLCDLPRPWGATWGSDDTIIFGGGSHLGLSRVSAAGGKADILTTPDPKKGEASHTWPHFLPGGKAILFTIGQAGFFDEGRIAVLDMRSGQQRVLLEGGSCARYAPTGHLIYARAGSLFAVRFDPNRLQVDGSPVPVVEGVSWQGGLGFADYSFSNSGTLVYVPSGGAEENRTMVWVDREGKSEPLPAAPRAYSNPHLSPDGKRIAVAILGREQNISDIWIYDLPRGILARLTSGYLDFAPVWTPDGARVTFRSSTSSRHSGIFWVPADSSAPPQQLVTTNEPATPGAWSPEGSALVFAQGLPAKTGIWMLQRSGDGGQWKAAPLFAANAFLPQLSPDGRWIAYVSGDSGNLQVYLQPFPGPGGKLQVSTDGGTSPRWARSARELFYRNGDKMMAIDIDTRQGLTAGRPRLLFEGQYEMSPPNMQPGTGYDVSADGKRFLMVKRGGQSSIAQFAVVQDWFEELKRLRTDK